jgi:hypothetical protein
MKPIVTFAGVLIVLSSPSACLRHEHDASESHSDPQAQPSATEPDEQAQKDGPKKTYGPAERIDLRPPTGAHRAIFEDGRVEVIIDAGALAERVSRGSAFEYLLQGMAEAERTGRQARFALEPGVPMNLVSEFLVEGDAEVRLAGSAEGPDHVLVVPWTYRSAPGHHASGGMQIRMPSGEVVLEVMTWIE